MSRGRHRLVLTARQKIAAIVVAIAIIAGIPVAVLAGSSAPAQAAAPLSYDNAAIADKALSYIGKPLGQACRDARTDAADGECRSFVNCVISLVSGGRQRTGVGWPNYFTGFENAGQRIYDVNALAKGDVVQQRGTEGPHLHTYIIVGRVSGSLFNVVDSNSDYKHIVEGGPGHNRTVALGDQVRAYRLGTVRGATSPPGSPQPVPQPVPQPSPRPVFPVMNTSEQPPDGVWFRDNPNAAGPRLNGYGVYAGDRVRLECFGWGQSIGAHANRLWYRSTNLTRQNAPGRANIGWLNAHYINDGKNANQIDPGVTAC